MIFRLYDSLLIGLKKKQPESCTCGNQKNVDSLSFYKNIQDKALIQVINGTGIGYQQRFDDKKPGRELFIADASSAEKAE